MINRKSGKHLNALANILKDEASLAISLRNLRGLLERNNRSELSKSIALLAHKYRNYEKVRKVYERILFQR